MAIRIELRHLRYFAAIAEERNLTRAAQRLRIQQPPLSQQLQALERELGVRLVERLPRGVELTPAGAAFLEDARDTLARVDAAAERARRVARGIHGSLVLGLASSAATHWVVPTAIAAFRDRHPDVHLSFVEGNAALLTEALVMRRAHAALLRAPVDRPPEIRFDRLFDEPMLAALPAAGEAAKRAAMRKPPYVTLRELAAHPLVLVRRPGAPGMYADLLAACQEAGIETQVAGEVGNMLTNILLVASGIGASVVPASMQGIQRDRVAYVGLRGAGKLSAPFTLLTRGEEANPVVGRFAAVVREIARGPAHAAG